MHSLDPTTAANITTKATAFAQSYGAAMNTSLDPSTTLESCAASLAAHYSPHFTAFALGAPPAKVAEGYASNTSSTTSGAAEASPHDKMTASVATHLRRFDAVGLGWAVKLVGFDVQPYAAGAAVVWMTWESVPREGCSVAGWQWTNVYGYRVGVGGGDEDKGCWEYALSDQEIGRLLERFPNFFTVEI